MKVNGRKAHFADSAPFNNALPRRTDFHRRPRSI